MDETAINKLPFPEDTDAPNGPEQIKALADALDVLNWGSRNLKPTVGIKRCSTELSLTEAFQDVAMTGGDLAITPAVASNLIVVAQIAVGSATNGSDHEFAFKVDAEAERESTNLFPGAGVGNRVIVPHIDVIPLSAAAHTIKLRARAIPNTGPPKVKNDGTWFAYALFAS